MKKLLSLLLMLCLCTTCIIPAIAESEGVYVLMNIPYTAFYAAEVDVAPTDAVSSAIRSDVSRRHQEHTRILAS